MDSLPIKGDPMIVPAWKNVCFGFLTIHREHRSKGRENGRFVCLILARNDWFVCFTPVVRNLSTDRKRCL